MLHAKNKTIALFGIPFKCHAKVVASRALASTKTIVFVFRLVNVSLTAQDLKMLTRTLCMKMVKNVLVNVITPGTKP